MKNISITFILTLFISLSGFAQNVEFHKSNFPGKEEKKELKTVLKGIKKGDKFFESASEHCITWKNSLSEKERYCKEAQKDFDNAIGYYLEAQKFNGDNALNNFKIGICLLNTIKIKESLDYLKRAYELDPNVDMTISYYLGKAYHLNMFWDEAITAYNKQLSKFIKNKDQITNAESIKKKIKECQSGKKLSENPARVFIDNIGKDVNSKFPEYKPQISADGSFMYFTSRRDNSMGGQISPDDNMYMEDIYITHFKDDKWTSPTPMSKPVNTKVHDALSGMSHDGEHLFIYNGAIKNGNIYVSELKGDKWTNPSSKKLDKHINTDYHETSACFSYDFNTIYFVSDKPGGHGGKDIYKSVRVFKKNKKDKGWGPAINLGPSINTPYDEEGVFMHPDGKTLYFSSKGHTSSGGYDIFKVNNINGIWGEVQNLGYPINSPDDDVFFTINAAGTKGYYSSIKEKGMGDQDIYVVTFLGPEKPMTLSSEDELFAGLSKPVSETLIEPVMELATTQLTLLKGIVIDDDKSNPIEASIDLIDNEKNETITTFTSNSSTGKFLVNLPSGKNYGLAIKAEGYLFHSENFNIPSSSQYQEVYKEIRLKKLEVGKTIVLNNIFFDFDKATLQKESFAELETLADLLNDNPNIKIEISGHTDNKGSDDYNQRLSEKRAKSVVEHLVNEKSIDAVRLVHKGYGESKPISTNDTEEGRQLNRRTEFKILSK